jgi:spoIIIJ-associated protein
MGEGANASPSVGLEEPMDTAAMPMMERPEPRYDDVPMAREPRREMPAEPRHDMADERGHDMADEPRHDMAFEARRETVAEPRREMPAPVREYAEPPVPSVRANVEPREREADARPMRDGARARREDSSEMSGPPNEALAALGKRWTEDLLKAMGFDASVSATAMGDRVDVVAEVTSDDEMLNGAKGEVRQALQHLLNRMVNLGEGSRYHLQLEINDFWKRREDELRELAAQLAEQAITSQSEAVTEYLNAQERRIIHVALRDDTRVKTYALGDGMIKRLAVAPAGFPEGGRTE